MGAVHWSPLCCLGQSCDLSTERRLPHACELFLVSSGRWKLRLPREAAQIPLPVCSEASSAALRARVTAEDRGRTAGATLTPMFKSGNRVPSLERPFLNMDCTHQSWDLSIRDGARPACCMGLPVGLGFVLALATWKGPCFILSRSA